MRKNGIGIFFRNSWVKLENKLLFQKWVDHFIKYWCQDKTEDWVENYHLLRFNKPFSNLTIHSCALQSPPGSLRKCNLKLSELF